MAIRTSKPAAKTPASDPPQPEKRDTAVFISKNERNLRKCSPLPHSWPPLGAQGEHAACSKTTGKQVHRFATLSWRLQLRSGLCPRTPPGIAPDARGAGVVPTPAPLLRGCCAPASVKGSLRHRLRPFGARWCCAPLRPRAMALTLSYAGDAKRDAPDLR